MQNEEGSPSAGVAYAVTAYGLWGFAPVYWKAVEQVPAPEVLAYRVVWSAVVAVLLLTATRRWGEWRSALANPHQAGLLALSSALIAINWLTFIWAVQVDRVIDTSLGYYINPLVSVALGLVVLREKLRPMQWFAVAIAAAGVAHWTVSLGGLPWVSAVLACSFGLYGLVRKVAPVKPIVGLGLETLFLTPVAASFLLLQAHEGTTAIASGDVAVHGLVALSGLVTAAPLLCFASAARRLSLSLLGLFQYIAPSIALLLAVWSYAEPFTRNHAITFGCVWLALAILSLESLLRPRAPRDWGTMSPPETPRTR